MIPPSLSMQFSQKKQKKDGALQLCLLVYNPIEIEWFAWIIHQLLTHLRSTVEYKNSNICHKPGTLL